MHSARLLLTKWNYSAVPASSSTMMPFLRLRSIFALHPPHQPRLNFGKMCKFSMLSCSEGWEWKNCLWNVAGGFPYSNRFGDFFSSLFSGVAILRLSRRWVSLPAEWGVNYNNWNATKINSAVANSSSFTFNGNLIEFNCVDRPKPFDIFNL